MKNEHSLNNTQKMQQSFAGAKIEKKKNWKIKTSK